MNVNTLNDAIKETVGTLQTDEITWLNSFYDKPPEELRQIEQVELVPRAIGFPLSAQEAVTKMLRTQGVSYVNTLWKKISEDLPVFSYTYIDWDSMNGEKEYSVNLSAEEFERVRNAVGGTGEKEWKTSTGMSRYSVAPIGAGIVAGGVTSVAIGLVNFFVPGISLPILIPALLVGTATAVLIYPVFREEDSSASNSTRNGSKPAQSNRNKESADSAKLVIDAAKKINREAIEKWCGELLTITQRTCEEIKP